MYMMTDELKVKMQAQDKIQDFGPDLFSGDPQDRNEILWCDYGCCYGFSG